MRSRYSCGGMLRIAKRTGLYNEIRLLTLSPDGYNTKMSFVRQGYLEYSRHANYGGWSIHRLIASPLFFNVAFHTITSLQVSRSALIRLQLPGPMMVLVVFRSSFRVFSLVPFLLRIPFWNLITALWSVEHLGIIIMIVNKSVGTSTIRLRVTFSNGGFHVSNPSKRPWADV